MRGIPITKLRLQLIDHVHVMAWGIWEQLKWFKLWSPLSKKSCSKINPQLSITDVNGCFDKHKVMLSSKMRNYNMDIFLSALK